MEDLNIRAQEIRLACEEVGKLPLLQKAAAAETITNMAVELIEDITIALDSLETRLQRVEGAHYD